MDRIPSGLCNIHHTPARAGSAPPPRKSFSAQQLSEMRQFRQAGAPTAEGRPLQGRLLREGAEKVKRKKEQTSSLGPSFLTCSHRPASDVPADVVGQPGLAPSSLAAPERSPENSRTPSPSRKAAPRGL